MAPKALTGVASAAMRHCEGPGCRPFKELLRKLDQAGQRASGSWRFHLIGCNLEFPPRLMQAS